jgi:hypothetical protein
MSDAPNPYDAPRTPLIDPAQPKRPERWSLDSNELLNLIILMVIGLILGVVMAALAHS